LSEASETLYAGDTLERTLTFTDENGDVFDPATIDISIKDPTGTVADSLTIDDLTNPEVGVYVLQWPIPGDAAPGTWTMFIVATDALGTVNSEAYTFAVLEPKIYYCSVDDVKTILSLALDDLTFDVELEACIVSADAIIDSELSKHSLSVPESVPQNIVDASAHFAAWLFRHRRDPTGAAAFWEEGSRFLSEYIETNMEIPFKAVSDQ
jgi:hypothetical protein